eukprot:1152765-Pelagomonas_calceolata.AAC.3
MHSETRGWVVKSRAGRQEGDAWCWSACNKRVKVGECGENDAAPAAATLVNNRAAALRSGRLGWVRACVEMRTRSSSEVSC